MAKRDWSSIVYPILSKLRMCPICGAGVGFSGGQLLCDFCLRLLQIHQITNSIREYFCEVRSLYRWEDQKLIQRLIYSSKGAQNPRNYRGFAELLIRQATEFSSVGNLSEVLFIPAPAASASAYRDHAYSLASALAEQLQAELRLSLVRGSTDQQKRLNQKSRWQAMVNRLACVKELTAEERNTRSVVFVDDLITTGVTAYAAYIALKKPKNFAVWTLFHRPRLRPLGVSDITRQLCD